MKPKKSINCGDWHKGWGFGGNDKVGKLSIETLSDCPINFVWAGHSQGRHGQTWNRGAKVRFMVIDTGLKITERKGSYPDYDQVIKAANILLRENSLNELPENCTIV